MAVTYLQPACHVQRLSSFELDDNCE